MSEPSAAYQAGYMFGAILGVLLVLGMIGMGVLSIIMAFVRKTKGWITMAIIFSVLGIAGIIAGVAFAAYGFTKVIAEQGKSKTVVTNEGWVRLTIPGSWRELPEFKGDGSLTVGNIFSNEFALVISERKDDINGTLDDFAKLATDGIRSKLEAGADVGPIEKAVAGKFAARRCRLAGTTDDLQIVYLHYSIETPEGFHQLLMWTIPSKERLARPLFEGVAASFEVANPPKSSAPKTIPKTLERTARKGTVEERVHAVLVEELKIPAEKVKTEARFKEDLGMDELDFVELVMASEEEFDIEINDDDAAKLTTVGALRDYVSGRVK